MIGWWAHTLSYTNSFVCVFLLLFFPFYFCQERAQCCTGPHSMLDDMFGNASAKRKINKRIIGVEKRKEGRNETE